VRHPDAVWSRALIAMKKHPDRTFTQIYGLFSMAKCKLPVAPDGVLDFAAAEVRGHICIYMYIYVNIYLCKYKYMYIYIPIHIHVITHIYRWPLMGYWTSPLLRWE
jgi:hypothetical protein